WVLVDVSATAVADVIQMDRELRRIQRSAFAQVLTRLDNVVPGFHQGSSGSPNSRTRSRSTTHRRPIGLRVAARSRNIDIARSIARNVIGSGTRRSTIPE